MGFLKTKVSELLSPTRRIVVTNIAWATSGKLVRVFTDVLVSIFVARYLGPAQYGLMNYVVSFVAIFSIIATFGLDNIEIREMAKPESDKNVVLGTAFSLRLLFALIALSLITLFLIIFKKDSQTTVLIALYSASVFFTSFNVIRNYFTAIVNNKYVAISEIIRSVVGASVKVALLFLKAPLIYFVAALVFDFILVAGGYITSYNKKAGRMKDWKFDKSFAKYLIYEAFPLLLSGAAIIIYQRIDQVIIKNLLNDESVGYFSVATKFSEFILFIPLIMSQTMSPLLVKDYEKDESTYNTRGQFFMDVIIWTSVACSLLVSVFSYYLIRYTFGVQYLASVPVLQIMAFKTVGMALSNSSGQMIIIEGKQTWAVFRNLIACVICVISNFILIPRFGIIGSAWATLVTVSFSGFFGNFIIKPYRAIFKKQVNSIFVGPIRLVRAVLNK